MKAHTVTITVTAPNRLSRADVAATIERLIWIGKEDAAYTLDNGEGDLKAARDACSLHLKSVRTE